VRHRNARFAYAAVLILVAAASGWPLPAAAAEKGWFGIEVSIEADGSNTNPMIHSVTIQKVIPDSPAAQAGLAVGDVILEADALPLPGMKTDMLRSAMAKQVGETLRLKVRRGGDEKMVSMVAVHKPPDSAPH
jgi:C-terminal processing protease CtpA/Prc